MLLYKVVYRNKSGDLREYGGMDMFIILLSTIAILPNMFISSDWGKVLGTLAQTNAGQSFNIHIISYDIMTLMSTKKREWAKA
ncbi:MAG: hypothetical protein GX270_05835 [Clostridiaceae bacterium]|jgi:hypothetical protein|nr:hypothetical protein [Clostridiaceae bacterium]